MIVVVIIGILGAIAVPSYKQYISQTKLAEGYLFTDNLKKLSVTYFSEKNRFFYAGASGDVITEITNGRRVILADYGWSMISFPVVNGVAGTPEYFNTFSPAHEPINFGIEVNHGGNDAGENPADSAALYAVIAEGTQGSGCVANAAIGRSMASDYGITTPGISGQKWFSIMFIGNFSTGSSNACTILVQTGQTTSAGLNVGPILTIK